MEEKDFMELRRIAIQGAIEGFAEKLNSDLKIPVEETKERLGALVEKWFQAGSPEDFQERNGFYGLLVTPDDVDPDLTLIFFNLYVETYINLESKLKVQE